MITLTQWANFVFKGGANMTNIPLALNVIFVGISVVFISLVVLFIVITLFVKILGSKKTSAKSTASVNDKGSNLNSVVENEVGVLDTESECSDSELVAVLTAAILASGRTRPESKIRVASYRRVPLNTPAWNAASRAGIISGKL